MPTHNPADIVNTFKANNGLAGGKMIDRIDIRIFDFSLSTQIPHETQLNCAIPRSDFFFAFMPCVLVGLGTGQASYQHYEPNAACNS